MKDVTSEKILKIRTEAGWDGVSCPTCTNTIYSPFRRYDGRGNIIHGCVDASHTGHLVTPSESSRWHNSKQAQAIRRAELKTLTGK